MAHTQPFQCGFVGSEDAYGLGIRIGAYTQWFASLLAQMLPKVESEALRTVNTCFQIAILASLAYWTCTAPDTLHPAEAFIMLLFCFGGVSACQSWSRNPFNSMFGSEAFSLRGIGDFIRNLVALGACSYGLWLTIRGRTRLDETACRTRVFFFAPVNLFGWYRYVLMAIFSFGILCGLLITVACMLHAYHQYDAWLKDWRNNSISVEPEPNERPSIAVFLTTCIALGVFIVAVELTIIWNGIEGVQACNSVGQLFPLIVGVAGLLRIMWCFARALVVGEISFRRR
ncbi:hypothetical protein PRZ48_005141 [Zasmidium cellare]|uniref:Uncharacterized protein n=1 Tax=Zasmidium cellare TaxID=395010 RepID=A0ABR0ESX4_ZASCE|nr:hypothetical protein PRZ48_005141 [Zasmidium cellare]